MKMNGSRRTREDVYVCDKGNEIEKLRETRGREGGEQEQEMCLINRIHLLLPDSRREKNKELELFCNLRNISPKLLKERLLRNFEQNTRYKTAIILLDVWPEIINRVRRISKISEVLHQEKSELCSRNG